MLWAAAFLVLADLSVRSVAPPPSDPPGPIVAPAGGPSDDRVAGPGPAGEPESGEPEGDEAEGGPGGGVLLNDAEGHALAVRAIEAFVVAEGMR